MKFKSIVCSLLTISSLQLTIVNAQAVQKHTTMKTTVVKANTKHKKRVPKNKASTKTVAIKDTSKSTHKTASYPPTLKLKANSALSTSWMHDSSGLDPVMNWEHDNRNQPLIAHTYGDKHNIVYYRIQDVADYGPLIQQAIDNWNKLGVISLQPAPDDSVVAINISAYNDPDPKNADGNNGITTYAFNPDYVGSANQFTDTHIYLEPNLKSSDDTQKIHTIEHEIGHALGFAHDTSQYFDPHTTIKYAYTTSVMTNSDLQKPNTIQMAEIPLGTREANNLRQHYNLP